MALGQKEIGRRVSEHTSGIATNASDLMLLAIRFNLDIQEAGPSISEIGSGSLKRSLIHLKSKGDITESSENKTGYTLTESGYREVEKFAPIYKEERNWDGKVYLINYDLPVTKNTVRNSFRDFIKEGLTCGMLQHSLWLTAYDPRQKLTDYINENELQRELVIVSAMNIETEMYSYQIPNLIEQAFHLGQINEEYRNYVNMCETDQSVSRERKIFGFLKILQKDPQVPFDLQSQDWAGYKAHEIFKSVV